MNIKQKILDSEITLKVQPIEVNAGKRIHYLKDGTDMGNIITGCPVTMKEIDTLFSRTMCCITLNNKPAGALLT